MADNVEFLVFHGAPDAPTVDVSARGVGVLVDDLAFGAFAPDYLSVSPAVYEIDIELADNSAVAASFVADLSGAADAALNVMASGFLAPASDEDPAFGLLAVFADGSTAMLPANTARLQVVHNSPYAAAAVVDVYINDALAIDDFAFRTATPFIDIDAGVELKIDITGSEAADNSAPVFSKTIPAPGLTAGETYTMMAAGDPAGGEPAFDLFVFAPGREVATAAGNVEFLVFHGSPDAPTVDVSARGVGVLVDDIAFGAYASDYLSVGPAVYDLDIELADNSAIAASFMADLSGAADAALMVAASGFLAPPGENDPAFGLLAIFADGSTALLPVLEDTANETELGVNAPTLEQNFPNPFSQRTTIGYELHAGSPVTLRLYDVMGREVQRWQYVAQPAGRHQVSVDASQLSGGMYFYVLETPDILSRKAMTVIH